MTRDSRPPRRPCRAAALASALESLESRLLLARLVGLDVSTYQPSVNWTNVKAAGKDFAFIRATAGLNTNDDQFANNTNATTGAQAKGLYSGFYHYAYYDLDSTHTAVAEADHYWSVVKTKMVANGKTMFPVLDVEEPLRSGWGAQDLVNWINGWCNEVKAKAKADNNINVTPLVYMGASNSGNSNYINSSVAVNWPLWVAQWPSTLPNPQTANPSGTGFWQSWAFWQYTSHGHVSGVGDGTTTNVDLDVFNGDAKVLSDFIIGGQGTWAQGTWLEVNTSGGLKAWNTASSNGTSVTVPDGTFGKIIGGPTYGNGYIRWQIAYNNGVTGWSAEPFLLSATPSIATNPNPANNASLSSTPTNFTWNAAANASSYKVYLDGVLKATVATNSWPHGTIANGAHTWRVDSLNDGIVTTGTTWNFAVNVDPPDEPSNPSPNGVIVNTKSVQLDWADSAGATSYDIYFGDRTTPTYTGLTVSEKLLPGPIDGDQPWRVVAVGPGGSTAGPQWEYIHDTTPPAVGVYGGQTPAFSGGGLNFTVTYSDATTDLDPTSLGDGDLVVTGPNGFSAPATFLGVDHDVAIYHVSAPAGGWQVPGGVYTVAQQAGEVADIAGNFSAGGIVGTFTVPSSAGFAYMDGNTLHVDYAAGAASVSLHYDAWGNVIAEENGAQLAFDLPTITDVYVNGTSGDDAVVIAAAFARPLTFNGQSGNDSIEIAAGGSQTFDADAGALNPNLLITVDPDGTAVFAATQHLGALSISGMASVTGTGNTLVTRTLDVSGTLDLSNNSLIVDYTDNTSPMGSWDGSAYTGLTGRVAAGMQNPTGIFSSTADSLRGLAIAEASDALGLSGNATDLFEGQTVDSTAVLIKFTYAGDANFDGQLNIDDYTQIDSSISAGGTLKGYFNGDFNLDGNVDIDDYTIIDSNIGIQGPPIP